jgi:hypothetical protein
LRFKFYEQKRQDLIAFLKEKRQHFLNNARSKVHSRANVSQGMSSRKGMRKDDTMEQSMSVRNLKDRSLMSPTIGSKSTMMKTTTSGFFSTKDQALAAETLKKTKMREAKMMLGLLKNEEIRSNKVHKQDDQYKRFLQRMEENNRLQEKTLKDKNEKRRNQELAKDQRLEEKERNHQKR